MGLGAGILGAVIGGICAGPLGAVIGGAIGANWGGGKKESVRRPAYDDEHAYREADSASSISPAGIRIFFQCLGKLAKADGQVSEDEAAFIRELMRSWQMDKETQRTLGLEFNAGRDSREPFEYLTARLAQDLNRCGAAPGVRKTVVQIFCSLVAVDRVIDPGERKMLIQAGKLLDAEQDVYDFFAREEVHPESDGGRRETGSPSSGPRQYPLAECYRILDIPASATDAEVKQAYRKKALEFHPDRVQGAGLSLAFIEFAKKSFQKIGIAYDTICVQRGMKK